MLLVSLHEVLSFSKKKSQHHNALTERVNVLILCHSDYMIVVQL